VFRIVAAGASHIRGLAASDARLLHLIRTEADTDLTFCCIALCVDTSNGGLESDRIIAATTVADTS
jgi:hypothetical protein